ncbi:MAG: hypothetical protein WDW38_009028 [Sanguina aurantia]
MRVLCPRDATTLDLAWTDSGTWLKKDGRALVKRFFKLFSAQDGHALQRCRVHLFADEASHAEAVKYLRRKNPDTETCKIAAAPTCLEHLYRMLRRESGNIPLRTLIVCDESRQLDPFFDPIIVKPPRFVGPVVDRLSDQPLPLSQLGPGMAPPAPAPVPATRQLGNVIGGGSAVAAEGVPKHAAGAVPPSALAEVAGGGSRGDSTAAVGGAAGAENARVVSPAGVRQATTACVTGTFSAAPSSSEAAAAAAAAAASLNTRDTLNSVAIPLGGTGVANITVPSPANLGQGPVLRLSGALVSAPAASAAISVGPITASTAAMGGTAGSGTGVSPRTGATNIPTVLLCRRFLGAAAANSRRRAVAGSVAPAGPIITNGANVTGGFGGRGVPAAAGGSVVAAAASAPASVHAGGVSVAAAAGSTRTHGGARAAPPGTSAALRPASVPTGHLPAPAAVDLAADIAHVTAQREPVAMHNAQLNGRCNILALENRRLQQEAQWLKFQAVRDRLQIQLQKGQLLDQAAGAATAAEHERCTAAAAAAAAAEAQRRQVASSAAAFRNHTECSQRVTVKYAAALTEVKQLTQGWAEDTKKSGQAMALVTGAHAAAALGWQAERAQLRKELQRKMFSSAAQLQAQKALTATAQQEAATQTALAASRKRRHDRQETELIRVSGIIQRQGLQLSQGAPAPAATP